MAKTDYELAAAMIRKHHEYGFAKPRVMWLQECFAAFFVMRDGAMAFDREKFQADCRYARTVEVSDG